MANFFENYDPVQARKSDGYQLLWKMKKKNTEEIIQFINLLINNKIINQDAITNTARMGNCKLGKILKNTDPHQVLTQEAKDRLAFTIFYLLPSLGKKEDYERLVHNKRNTHCIHTFADDQARQKYQEQYVKTFGYTGYHLVNDMEDHGNIRKILDYYFELFNNSPNNKGEKR